MAGLLSHRSNTPGMEQSTAQRRLVKSPPELWAEVSSEHILRRHLSEFGEIRIIRVDPETTVAWEGDRASGTVELAAAGWGTKVVLTATPVVPEAPAPVIAEQAGPEPAPAVLVAPVPVAAPATPSPRRGLLARLLRRRVPVGEIPAPGPPIHDPSPPTPAPDPTPPDPGPMPGPDPTPPIDPVPPAPEPGPTPPPSIELDPGRTIAILTDVLDDLGTAHRRPSLDHS